MNIKHTPGPWQVAILEGSQESRPYFVCRQLSASHWDHLRDASGSCARFESREEAAAAVAKEAGAGA